MKKDFILTFLTQIIVLVSGLAVFKLAMTQFGDIGFSEFSIIKRNLAYVYTIILLGLGIAVPRYIAIELGKKTKNENSIFIASLLIIGFLLFITAIITYIFNLQISFLLFGDKKYFYFIFPIYISILGLSLNEIVFSFYRGKSLFTTANILQIINLGFVPLLVFLFSKNISEVFLYSGMLMILTSSYFILKVISSEKFNWEKIKNFIPTLLRYGIKRVPADFGLASILVLPVIFASHSHDLITAGYIAFSISLLNLSGHIVAPIGLIMLPKISHLIGERNFTKIQEYVKKLFLFSLIISILGTITYQFFAKEILNIYLGKVELDLIDISKHIMWGILFYPFYVTMRSIIDAYYTRAYNTISILVSLIAFLLVYLVTQNIYNALILSLAILAIMTLYFIRPLLVRIEYETI